MAAVGRGAFGCARALCRLITCVGDAIVSSFLSIGILTLHAMAQ